MNELRKAIEEERKKKAEIIEKTKSARHRLAYKQMEYEAFSKMNEGNKERTKNIGYLRRLKEKLEFRISTESSTLDSERDLIRKIKEVDVELDKAIKSYRMKRKVELVASDIESLKKEIDENEKLIAESNKKLDDLYSKLRGMTNFRPRETKPKRRENEEPKPLEISLADIAIIKNDKNNSNNKSSGNDKNKSSEIEADTN